MLEAKQLDDLWFATIQSLMNYLKLKKIKYSRINLEIILNLSDIILKILE